jgi:aldehyde dehydrogenase (NAD+)
VITVIRARDADDALGMANGTSGRSAAVFTRDTERGARFALAMRAGMIHVNDSPASGDADADAGGAIEAFTTLRRVSVRPAPGSPA